jgi:thiol-disulfide isomerase/thioredoxin
MAQELRAVAGALPDACGEESHKPVGRSVDEPGVADRDSRPQLMRRISHPVRASAFALVLSATTLAFALAPSRALAVDAGQPVPSFSARSLDGDTTLALSAYRGKVVYLDFWASWCGPCQTAMPLIEQLRTEFPSDQFQVIAVNLDEKPEKAKKESKKK